MDGQTRRGEHVRETRYGRRRLRRRDQARAAGRVHPPVRQQRSHRDGGDSQQLQPDFALAGIQVTLSQGSFDDVINSATPCVAGSACTWDLEYWDSPWIYAPDYYPTGDELWACVGSGASAVYASSNVGGYCDPQAEADIVATQSDASLTSMHAYEDYLARTLPVIWFPVAGLRTRPRSTGRSRASGPLIHCCRSTRRTGAGPEPGYANRFQRSPRRGRQFSPKGEYDANTPDPIWACGASMAAREKGSQGGSNDHSNTIGPRRGDNAPRRDQATERRRHRCDGSGGVRQQQHPRHLAVILDGQRHLQPDELQHLDRLVVERQRQRAGTPVRAAR